MRRAKKELDVVAVVRDLLPYVERYRADWATGIETGIYDDNQEGLRGCAAAIRAGATLLRTRRNS